jgi:hypothetical protein
MDSDYALRSGVQSWRSALNRTLFWSALSLTGCSAPQVPIERITTTFYCSDNRSFVVERGENSAAVFYLGVRYDLSRSSSSIGERYANRGATLIIDADLAAFATSKVIDLDYCQSVVPQA